MLYEKDGKTFEFELNIDKIMEVEKADPNYSIVDDLQSMEDGKLRFVDLARIAGYIDTSFDGLKEQGLFVADLLPIFTGCLEDLGFTSEE